MLLLSDPRIADKPVIENREPCADFRAYPTDVLVDLSRKHIGNQSEAFLKVRYAVLKKVLSAAKCLPPGVKFLIKEAYRPATLQQHYFDTYRTVIAQQHPDYSPPEVYRAASKFVAPVAVAPHPTGGAVDLTLALEDGTELNLGTRFNASPLETQNACFTSATNISEKARARREVMSRALQGVGMINYPTEWWHWSFGDKYWAVTTNAEHAVYGPLAENEL